MGRHAGDRWGMRGTTVVVGIVLALAGIAHANDRTEIRGVTFEEAGGITRVHVRATSSPMFSVLQLELRAQ